jgi:hypothetical protein
VTRRLIAIAAAIFVSSSCAYAQGRGMGTPTPAVPTTSPLGMSTSGTAIAPTGIPLGAAPLATPGVSSGSLNGVASATACSSPGASSAMTSPGMANPMTGDIGLYRVRCERRRNHDRRDAAGSSGSDHNDVRPSFRNRQRHGLAVEHFDACDLATGRPDDSDGLDRTKQSGSQPGPVSGNGQHGLNVFRCLLMRKRRLGSIQCDAS